LILYLKEENSFGSDKEAGLDAVGRLVEAGVCLAIKYAVVRSDPAEDTYLEGLLKRVDCRRVISGIGERPALIHLRDWKLTGFTTGSGCLAPRLSQAIFEACGREDYAAAERLRSEFIPLEDLRDAWGPAKVLHFAAQLAGVCETGPVPPYLSSLSAEQLDQLRPVAQALLDRDARR
jgi:dihydrodipicolinate synthase/N-acetylneuraminate lyase